MLKRSTLGLLVGAIALGGSVLWFEGRSSHSESASTALSDLSTKNSARNTANSAETAGEKLFPFAEADVEQVALKRPGESLVFRKNDDDTWQMTSPKTAAAEDGAVAFLLNQIENPTVKTLTVKASDLAEFGLEKPAILVDLIAAGKPYQLAVGAADFSGDKRYVRTINDSSASDGANGASDAPKTEADAAATPVKIHVVSGSLFSATERPTPEWLTQDNP